MIFLNIGLNHSSVESDKIEKSVCQDSAGMPLLNALNTVGSA